MKKVKGILNAVIIILLLLFITGLSIMAIYGVQVKKIEDEMSNVKIYDIEANEQKTITLIEENTNIGKLTIPAILLESAPVNEGIDLDTLNKSIGHFTSTSIYYGNVGLASHNGGTENANYFENLHNIKVGDQIYYETIYGTKKYEVKTIEKIASDNWDYLQATEDNRITLITCVKNKPNLRLCVQGIEIK